MEHGKNDMDEATSTTIRTRVAIVGAGACGLQCAASLLDANEEVLILEARNRIGGRIYTTHETRVANGSKKEFYLDHGAAWIHGTGCDWPSNNSMNDGRGTAERGAELLPETMNPMMHLLQRVASQESGTLSLYESHLKPICTEGNPWTRPGHVLHNKTRPQIVLYMNGQRLDRDRPDVITDALQIHSNLLEDLAALGAELWRSDRDAQKKIISTSLQEGLDQLQATQKAGQPMKHPVSKAGVTSSLSHQVAPFYRYLIECWYGCTTSEMQLYEFIDDPTPPEVYSADGDFYGPHCTLRKGMRTILDPLIDRVSIDRIRLNDPVVAIQKCSEGVRLETASGCSVHADCCVVTVPIGCLQHAVASQKSPSNSGEENSPSSSQSIRFIPPLSQPKQDAIFKFRMGPYKKVFLTFDRIFWPKEEAFLGLVRSQSNEGSALDCSREGLGSYLLIDNLWARDEVPCLEAVLFGRPGTWATGKSNDALQAAVLEFMQEAMGLEGDTLKEWCVDCHVTRWEEDEFSRGAYSSFCLGTVEEDTEELVRPEWGGRLVIAGEATISEFEGSVHGALMSAKATAENVSRLLCGDDI